MRCSFHFWVDRGKRTRNRMLLIEVVQMTVLSKCTVLWRWARMWEAHDHEHKVEQEGVHCLLLTIAIDRTMLCVRFPRVNGYDHLTYIRQCRTIPSHLIACCQFDVLSDVWGRYSNHQDLGGSHIHTSQVCKYFCSQSTGHHHHGHMRSRHVQCLRFYYWPTTYYMY